MKTSDFEHFEDTITSGENLSYWLASVQPIIYKELRRNIETDVLIVGGGIAGLSTAYCLASSGQKVTVVDDGYIGSGETGRTTAHLTCALDDRYFKLEKIFGTEKTQLAANSHMAAIEWIEQTVKRENIDCHFNKVPGYLFLHPNDEPETLEKEYECTRRAGLLTRMRKEIPGIAVEGKNRCIEFPNQGQFHILMYLKGLADAVVRLGGEIYTSAKAENIHKNGAKVNGHRVTAKYVVVATNTPVNDLVTMHTKQFPYRTYVIATKIPKGKLPYALWWDTGDPDSKWITQPYHYVRLEEFDSDHDLLISGGEDHKTGQADDEDIPEEERFIKLEQWTRKWFPAVENIEYKWSGQVMEPIDSMAFIGRNPGDENIYIITGDSGNGMTHGTIGGILISDLINGKKNSWEEIYDPSRITLKTAGDYLHEVANMAAQYADWISPADIKEAGELQPGEGGILSAGLKKIAVYRDEHNALHAFNASCPHLGCVIQWNAEEKSFDCPCHGSRFTTAGEVINGPAISALKKIAIRDRK